METDPLFFLLQGLFHRKRIASEHSYMIQNSEFVSSENFGVNTKFYIKVFHIHNE
jgi:hypothetical protein